MSSMVVYTNNSKKQSSMNEKLDDFRAVSFFLAAEKASSFYFCTVFSLLNTVQRSNTYGAAPVGCHAVSVVLRCREAEGILRGILS